MIDYTKFRLSLKRLEEQYENYRHLDPSLPRLTYEAVPESVVKRFKTCFSSLQQVLKRFMAEELGIPDVPNSPKPLLRLANENGLLAGRGEDWLDYARHRDETANDYSVEKAARCLKALPGFIQGAIELYQTMTSRSWTLTSSRTAPPSSGRSTR